MSQQFCLKWNSHMTNMMEVFKSLLSTESMVDVTLACDGLSLKAHKMVLSACSPFFQSLFLENPCKHPIVILKDMKYTELKAIIEFMYHGEVNVGQDQLSALMKTAETLRVKGLAEVTNEKNSQSSNANQDEPSHRSVPRTETPPPAKRRRGRMRKRSHSDSNRSDDESNEPKIKQPVSPDIEELSGDHTMEATSGHFSSIQSQVPMQQMPSHSTNSFQRTNVSQEPQVEEPTSADESEFGVEPAKLLEQTLTTDDLTNARRGRSAAQSSMEMQRRSRSTDHSSSLVPTSLPSDSYSSSMNQQLESPPDIKPELLDLDPPISPVPGPSHSADNSMMFDQSSVSSHPGTSFQDNSGALVPQDSSPQVHQRRYNRGQDNIPAEVLPFLKQRPGLSIQPAGRPDAAPPPPKPRVEIIPPLPPQSRQSTPPQPRLSTPPQPSQQQRNEAQRSSATRYHCEFCPYDTSSIQKLQSHLNSHQPSQHPMNIPNYCKPCNLQFASPAQLQAHLATHDAPRHTCMYCDKNFKTPATLKAHMKMHLGREAVPYERRCMFCEKTFRNEDHYQRHMMTVHSMG